MWYSIVQFNHYRVQREKKQNAVARLNLLDALYLFQFAYAAYNPAMLGQLLLHQ